MNDLNLEISANIPENRLTELKVDLECIVSTYKGLPLPHLLVTKIAEDLEKLSLKYPGFTVKNNEWYTEKIWTLEQLLSVYKKEYPERYNDKEEYSHGEINNILFDLKMAGVILGYRRVIPRYIIELNDLFNGEVTVDVPIINIKPYKGNKTLSFR